MSMFLVNNCGLLFLAGFILLALSLPFYLSLPRASIFLGNSREALRDLWRSWSFQLALLFDVLGSTALVLGFIGLLTGGVQ